MQSIIQFILISKKLLKLGKKIDAKSSEEFYQRNLQFLKSKNKKIEDISKSQLKNSQKKIENIGGFWIHEIKG